MIGIVHNSLNFIRSSLSPLLKRHRSVLSEDARNLNSDDPLFQLHKSIHSNILGSRLGWGHKVYASNFPLQGIDLEGYCIDATNFAGAVLQRTLGIPRSNICYHFTGQFMDSFENVSPKVKREIAAHSFLTIKDAHKFFSSSKHAGKFDVVFDATAAQFSGKYFDDKHDDPVTFSKKQSLFGQLAMLGGELGKEMVRDLIWRGYIILPHDKAGDQKTDLLMRAFIARQQLELPSVGTFLLRDLRVESRKYIKHVINLSNYCRRSETGRKWIRNKVPVLSTHSFPSGRFKA